MASPAPPRSKRLAALHTLVTADMFWRVWLPVGAIGLLHYTIDPHQHAVHDVLRRLYYVPILIAAFSRGLRGGLAVAVISSLTYAPHAFLLDMQHDPGTTLNKLLEVVLYHVIGVLAGALADRESKRRRQVEAAYAAEHRMSEQLIRAGRLAALGELVAGVAHEIKNPLHTIKGTAEIVDEIIPKAAEQAGMWRLLRQEVDRLERVAERFLSFARPAPPNLSAQPYQEVYARVVQLLSAQMHNHPGVALRVRPLPNEVGLSVVHADPDQIAQVALNIGSNAVRALASRGVVEVSGSRRDTELGSFVALSLANDGPPIPEADLERVFDPFYTRSENGTGLGLAIASRIAEGHRGVLEVANTGKERGVVFTLLLPVRLPTNKQANLSANR